MSDPLVGRTIGDVEITARLGAGGMGAVYVGRDALSEAQDRVALKLLNPDNAIPAVMAADPGVYDLSTITPFVAHWAGR